MSEPRPLRVLAWPVGRVDDLNPYVRMTYSAFQKPHAVVLPYHPLMGRVPAADVFHVQWPEGIFEGKGAAVPGVFALKALRVLETARSIRRAGGKVVLTAHNVAPHATLSWLKLSGWRRFFKSLLAETDLIISLSKSALEEFSEAHSLARSKRHVIIPYPNYRGEYHKASREDARSRYGLHAPVVLGIIGSLRRSKGVVEAVQAFRTAGTECHQLLIAGGCDLSYQHEISSAIGGDRRVAVLPATLENHELSTAVAGVDGCLINQTRTLNSGTALLGLSLDRRVIAPRVGSLIELERVVGADWLRLFTPPLQPSFLSLALKWMKDPVEGCDAMADFEPFDISQKMLATFEDLIGYSAKRLR